MTEQGGPPLAGEWGSDDKKLRKRRKRLQERLQEASGAQERAQERLRRAEARLQKRQARVQRLQERLAAVEQQLAPTVSDAASPMASAEDYQHARDARQMVDVVEEEARIAVERALEVEGRQDVPGLPRDLAHDLEQVRAEAAAEEQLLANVTMLEADEERGEVASAVTQVESEAGSETDVSKAAIEEAKLREEEETVEKVAALIVSDAAALAAARAEAQAEASSVRVREASEQVRQAEQAWTQLRVSVQNGILSGEKAEAALHLAEQEVAHARAVLAEAEAAEKRAVESAQDADAEAGVTEGMAVSAAQRLDDREPGARDEAEADDQQSSSI